MSFVIYAGSVGFKATRCLCFLREDCWIWCCHSYSGLGLEESAAITCIWRVVEYLNLDMTWYGCFDILTPVFSPLVQSLHKLYKCANCWLISLWRMSLRSEHRVFFSLFALQHSVQYSFASLLAFTLFRLLTLPHLLSVLGRCCHSTSGHFYIADTILALDFIRYC